MTTRTRIIGAIALSSAMAASVAAQDDDLSLHEIFQQDAADRPSSPGLPQSLRPLDDSDPEMKELLDALFDLTPCGPSPTGLCPEALGMLTGGGDRLASYLITQHEQNDLSGFPNRGTYLRLLGHTESTTAFNYLSNLVGVRAQAFSSGTSRDDQPLIFAIEALGRTRDVRAVPVVLELIDGFSDPEVRIRAVNAADRIQAKNGPQPEIAARLTALETELSEAAPVASLQSGETLAPTDALARRVNSVLAAPGQTQP